MILAGYYEIGHGTKQNLKKALEWYNKSIEAGCIEAIERLDPKIKDADVYRQFRKLQMLDMSGIDVSYALSEAYENGIGTEIDLDKAREYLVDAADKGDLEAEYKLAVILEKDGKYHEALGWYRKAAEHGDRAAIERIDLDHLSSMSQKKQFENLMLYSEEGDPQILFYIGRYKE